MDAVHAGQPPEGETHVSFETAAEHATARVPVAGRFQRAGDVRKSHDSSADTIVLDDIEVSECFVPATGPGAQNVYKGHGSH